ncbi:phage tail tape measure protein [Pseudocitrobacter sp. RIT415]|uniref:phage tail tape measure protein n=1 Tax=Pseudocitrobacter sp. RIT415 TaxID=2202163 RepID=UPI000D34E370|nr:phage tail tape measure protein [Pseudocitrobacter sp. RIT 415]RAU45300.1 phage tail tape measure protein [Pseudocitrobacter sp. RIT 415]
MATNGSSDKRSQLFLQSVKIGSTEIPRSMIASCLYIEIADLTGPQLRLEIHDSSSYVVDQLGVKKGTILTCSFGDPQGLGNTTWVDTFEVLKAPQSSDMVTIIAFSEKVKALKQPAPKPQFFVKKQPANIVSALATALTVSADNFKKLGTYHLNMGQKPSGVLAQMAQEAGALCWVCRGTINVKSMATLSRSSPALTYEANNPKAPLRLNRFAKLNNDDQYIRSRQYRLMAYHPTKGLLTAGDKSWPVKMVSVDDQTALNNLSTFLLPKIDVEVTGNSAITPGLPVKVLIHNYNSESGLDESVPTKLIVRVAAHQEDRFGYVTRAVLGVIYDGTN